MNILELTLGRVLRGPACRPALLLLLLTCQCVVADADERLGRLVFESPVVDSPAQPLPPPVDVGNRAMMVPLVLTFTVDDQLALVDPSVGSSLARAAASSSVGVRDVAYDERAGRALVFESDEDEQAGEISTYALRHREVSPSIGAREHRAWVDGAAALWPAPGGIVVFERGIGDRWRLLRDDGLPTSSLAAPCPASLFARRTPAGLWLQALSWGPPGEPPALDLVSAWVGAGELHAADTVTIGEPASVPVTARLVPLPEAGVEVPAEQALVVDVRDGQLELRLLVGGELSPPVSLPVPGRSAGGIGRVEQVLLLHRNPHPSLLDQARVAVLLSEPSQLCVANLAGGLSQVGVGCIGLAGQVRVHDRFFARDLVAAGSDRLLAATSEGVWAVDVQVERGLPQLALDPQFEGSQLRGPLASVPSVATGGRE